jgi:hypothetical protein
VSTTPVMPNFFIVGTGKAGTTSLYHYLRQHPQIYLSPIKEPCYFAEEICQENLSESYRQHVRRMSRRQFLPFGGQARPFDWLVKDWGDYLRLFEDARNAPAVGEATVAYLWSETAAGNIATQIPGAKIVIMLRDPADRAFSQYAHQLNTGLLRGTFREHIRKCMDNRDRKISVYYPFLEVGLYHNQVQRYLALFPGANIRIYWYEHAWRDTAGLCADLFEFLQVDRAFRPDFSQKSLQRRVPRFPELNYAAKQFEAIHWLAKRVPDGWRQPIRKLFSHSGAALKMDRSDRQYLVDYYREDVLNLAALVNRDLSAWLAC